MESKVEVDEAPQPELQPTAAQPSPPSEIAQMVCGSCRRLLQYPRGARPVECSCCRTVNFVLEGTQQAPSMVRPTGAITNSSKSCSLNCLCEAVYKL